MKIIKRVLLAAFLAVAVLPVSTAQGQSGSNSGGSGLSITPTKFEFVIERGKAELASMQVKNVTDRPILVRAFLNDFEQDGISGNPKLITDASQERSANSLREFIEGLEDITVEPGEVAVVDVPIQVPEEAAPGGYYGALRFQSAPVGSSEDEATSPQVSLNASVAALVLVEVPGDITEKIEIKSIGAYLSNDKKGSLFTKKPSKIGIEINNLGNGFSRPFGKVTMAGPWGGGEVLSYELNDTSPRGNVLPNSTRLFLDEMNAVKWPGRYTITGSISHGRGGEILIAKSSFWYIPSWLIITLAVLLVVMIALIVILYRKYVTKSTRRNK